MIAVIHGYQHSVATAVPVVQPWRFGWLAHWSLTRCSPLAMGPHFAAQQAVRRDDVLGQEQKRLLQFAAAAIPGIAAAAVSPKFDELFCLGDGANRDPPRAWVHWCQQSFENFDVGALDRTKVPAVESRLFKALGKVRVRAYDFEKAEPDETASFANVPDSINHMQLGKRSYGSPPVLARREGVVNA
jgi:hypothetical protein